MTAKTPPMGWNSWDCYGAAVDEKTVRINAECVAKHLKPYGYEYIVVDIQWSEPNADSHQYHAFAPLCMDEFSRLMPAVNRFPSAGNGVGFRALGDYIHSLGLKFGIHIMRGIPRQAAHQNTAICGTQIRAAEIAVPNSICHWNSDMYGVNPKGEGAKEYYNSLFTLYASWGVDFVKVDDIANHYAVGELELIRAAIDQSGRDMVLSISPGPAPLAQAEHLKQHINMWRITDDFWDKWELLYDMFDRAEKWCTHAGPGHWPDADMLPVGAIRQNSDPENRTRFTKDEQVTMMTLWCFLRSPLMIGGELSKLDEFTTSLLTNSDLLAMLEHSRDARQVYRRGTPGEEVIVWQAAHKENGRYIALFNTGEAEANIHCKLGECELFGAYTAFDLWSKEKIACRDTITAKVPGHGVKAFLLR